LKYLKLFLKLKVYLKIATDSQRTISKENSSYEDLHRRLCAVERDRELALMKLEAREVEIRQLQAT